MDHKRKLLASKGKGKLTTPPSQKSPKLAGLSPSLPPISSKIVLKPNNLLVLALAANSFDPHSRTVENTKAPILEELKATKGKRTARISVKPVRRRFSQRIIAKDGLFRPKPKKAEVINLSSDDEAEEKDLEESFEPEEIPMSWSLLSPSTTASKGGDVEYDDPRYWDFDEDLDQWGTYFGDGGPEEEPAPAEGSKGSSPGSSSSSD
ncbi:hypothetical protein PIB30_058048 [Stylosanthes scabra]|uniref:Uncharacterized protein n=1 Tax=Stylosanthes scabra TaxID=79078 RepID=A0ABU6XHS4_9FABA|nr:hypothetical protein [Stylosanthes scabra]